MTDEAKFQAYKQYLEESGAKSKSSDESNSSESDESESEEEDEDEDNQYQKKLAMKRQVNKKMTQKDLQLERLHLNSKKPEG